MNRNFIFAFAAAGFCMLSANAQTAKDSVAGPEKYSEEWWENRRKEAIITNELPAEKERIEKEEKFKLKVELERIAQLLEDKKITSEEAKTLKEDAAKKAALNIDNKKAIVDNLIELKKRDDDYQYTYARGKYLDIGLGNSYDDAGSATLGISYENGSKTVIYDKRTTSDVVLSFGFNASVQNDRNSPFKFWKSNFSEIGYNLKTRLLKDSNFLRLSYGASIQLTSLEASGNQYFVDNGRVSELQPFSYNLKQQQFRMTNLVVPVFLEFGPSVKKEYYNRFRYETINSFRFGIGGYAGVNLATSQWLKYEVEGDKRHDKLKRDYNVNDFNYGVSAYVGYGVFSVFARYELSPVFRNNPVDQNMLSIGLRLEL